jgi:Flp pilus assembly protein protease CpaA
MMVLDLSVASILSFCTITVLLAIYSFFDIHDRNVKNEFILTGAVVGCIVFLLTGHFTSNVILHVFSLVMVAPLVYILFRIGSIGGADAKSLFVVSLISPGIELGVWNQPILEAIIGLGGELIVMLLGGYLYWRFRGNSEDPTPPLLPFLLMGYLVIQMLALF